MTHQSLHQELALPEGPQCILRQALPILLEFISSEPMTLGGGTALAARWQHRVSLDIDLFVDPAVFEESVYRRQAEFEDRIGELGSVRFAMLGVEGCRRYFENGQADLTACFPLTPDSRSQDSVAGTEIALETSAEIPAKKLHLRMLRHGEIVPRDLYDLAVARHLEPDVLAQAWEARRIDDRSPLLAVLSSFSPPWMQRQEQIVLEPRDPALEQDAVQQVMQDIRERFRSRSLNRELWR